VPTSVPEHPEPEAPGPDAAVDASADAAVDAGIGGVQGSVVLDGCDRPWTGLTGTIHLDPGTSKSRSGPSYAFHADGAFAFAGVTEGTYDLWVESPSVDFPHGFGGDTTIVVSAGATATFTFHGYGWGWVHGTATYSDGRADDSGIVVGINNALAGMPSATTDALGSYSIHTTCGNNYLEVTVPVLTPVPSETVDVPFEASVDASPLSL
jgi:hypothetical protein